MNRILILVLSFTFLSATYAVAESPGKTLSLTGGYFMPDIDNWKDHYGEGGIWTFGIEGGWKLTRQIELSLGLRYGRVEGTAITLSGRQSTDSVNYHHIPVHASVLYRFIYSEDQIVAPYVGGGYTHFFYIEKLNDKTYSGDRMGYHLRTGLQLLLDYFDPSVADDLSKWGISNTYFTIEALYSSMDDFGGEDIDPGGWNITGGLLFEY